SRSRLVSLFPYPTLFLSDAFLYLFHRTGFINQFTLCKNIFKQFHFVEGIDELALDRMHRVEHEERFIRIQLFALLSNVLAFTHRSAELTSELRSRVVLVL